MACLPEKRRKKKRKEEKKRRKEGKEKEKKKENKYRYNLVGVLVVGGQPVIFATSKKHTQKIISPAG